MTHSILQYLTGRSSFFIWNKIFGCVFTLSSYTNISIMGTAICQWSITEDSGPVSHVNSLRIITCPKNIEHYNDVIMGVSNHQPNDCLLNRLFRGRSMKTSKFRVTGLCEGNSPGTGEFPAQMASNAENVSIWWRHHGSTKPRIYSVEFNENHRMETIESFWTARLRNTRGKFQHDVHHHTTFHPAQGRHVRA